MNQILVILAKRFIWRLQNSQSWNEKLSIAVEVEYIFVYLVLIVLAKSQYSIFLIFTILRLLGHQNWARCSKATPALLYNK